MILRALFALSIAAYPAEFRREYRSQLFLDFDDRRSVPGELLRLFLDTTFGGMAMRCEMLWRDLAYAVRTLSRARLFSGIVIGTLAIAIAANAIVFGALYAVIIAPFPFAHMDRLAVLNGQMRIGPTPGLEVPLPLDFARTYLRDSAAVESVAGSAISIVHAQVDGRFVALHEGMVTSSYFRTLGIAPYLGAFFGAKRSDATRIVISYKFWREHFGANAAAIGKDIVIDGRAFIVAGVAPPDMFDPAARTRGSADVWTTFPPETSDALYNVTPLVRMRPGVTIAQLQADAQRLWRAAGSKNPFLNSRFQTLQAHALRDVILGDRARSLWILFGAVAAVLIVGCANVANLLLARGASRSNEFAIRSALGAARRRVAAQIVIEALVLSVAGCAIGLLLAAFGMGPALALIPGDLPRLQTAHVDAALVLYVCALCILVTLLAGMVPALRKAPAGGLRSTTRARTALVSTEIGIAFALLVCSGLLLRSFVAMISQDVGFDPRNLYVASFLVQSPGGAAYAQNPRDALLAKHVQEQIRVLPGVTGVALGTQMPFGQGTSMMFGDVWIQGQPRPRPGRFTPAQVTTAAIISPEFIPLMRIPVLQGRAFRSTDVRGAPAVLVNETFAREFLPGKSIAGKRIQSIGGSAAIIGVVGDVRTSLTQDPRPLVYFPMKNSLDFQVAIRTSAGDSKLAAQIAPIAHRLDPQIGTPPVISMQRAIRDSAASAHAAFALLSALALIALLLALAGIYGIVAFSVARRYHEIGVRLALGATNADIFRRTIAGALMQSLFGIALGIVGAALAANALQTQLFHVSPLDPVTFAATAGLLIACTALAAAIAAWRAMRIDPARTLRYE